METIHMFQFIFAVNLKPFRLPCLFYESPDKAVICEFISDRN